MKDGSVFDLHADENASFDAVARLAGPAEAAGYRAFSRRMADVFETLQASFVEHPSPTIASLTRSVGLRGIGRLTRIAPFDSLWNVVGTYFSDPRLQQLFGRYATYCGASPFAAPGPLMLIAHVEQLGVWLVEGGLSRIAEATEKLAKERGVVFRYGADVSRIDLCDGRGLRRPSDIGETIEADAVVFNGEPAALSGGLLGQEVRGAVSPWPARHRSLSALTWSIRGKASGFPCPIIRFFLGRFPRRVRRSLPSRPPAGRSDHLHLRAGSRRLRRGGPLRGREPVSRRQRPRARRHRPFRRGGDPVMRITSEGASGASGPRDFGPARSASGNGTERLCADVSGLGRSALRPGLTRLGLLVPAPGSADENPGTLPRGRSGPSGAGRTDGSPFGPSRRLGGDGAFGFDRHVPPGGYAWWYFDAISHDGQHALTIIAFVGSVFSPYYASARRQGQADPLNHVGINAILYTPRGKYWALTERGRSSLTRSPDRLGIGPSTLNWTGDRLVVDIEEWTAPLPQRLRGRITVDTGPLFERCFELHENGRHQWRPVAPCASVEVDFERPDVAWQGKAYVDMNTGAEPLEAGFKRWNWSRRDRGESTRIHYDVVARDGRESGLALEYRKDGTLAPFEAEPIQSLPGTGWRVSRQSHPADGRAARVLRTLEDTPFYSRSMLAFDGGEDRTIHESVDLDRFRSRWVQAMLPFKMPRLATWRPTSSASPVRSSAMAIGRSS